MDTTISRILGEDIEPVQTLEKDNLEPFRPPEVPPENSAIVPEDAEIDELSNLWNSGNKSEVLHRYFEMDNETSVKLVFAIGLDGALALARAADQMIEQGEFPDDGGGSRDAETEELFGADRLIGSNFDLEGRFGNKEDYLEPKVPEPAK